MSADVAGRLRSIRENDRQRLAATALGLAVGLALAWVHWVGLVVGGAAVALPQPRARSAVAASLGFGALVLAVFGTYLAAVGALGAALGMGQITLVSVGIGLGLPLFGSLARGVV